MTIRTIIVDDEKLAIQGLQLRLDKFADVEVIDTCSNGREAIRKIKTEKPDLVFLDIQMPDLDGFDVLESLPRDGRRPHVVFVTAHSEHAVRAFEARAVDYLLKPISAERLRQAIERVRPQPHALGARSYPLRLAVPGSGRIQLVPVDEIDHISAHANYVELHMGSRALVMRETMSNLEDQLDPQRFVRVHRSRIVRIDGIVDVEPYASGQYLLRLKCGVRVASGRSYLARLREVLNLA